MTPPRASSHRQLRLTIKECEAVLEVVAFRLAGDYEDDVDDGALETARDKLAEACGAARA